MPSNRKNRSKAFAIANCRAKSRTWDNVFDTLAEARIHAKERQELTGIPMHAYKCPICQRYHAGSDRGRRRRK